MKIHLIRHAQSLANAEHVWTGQRDIPLSPLGISEQEKLCGLYKYPEAEIYFSSPLSRCTRSLEIIYGRPADILAPMLSECALGILEGRPYTNLDDDPQYTEWLANPERPVEGGESFAGFTRRVCSGFDALIKELLARGVKSAAGTMHGNVMRAVLHRFADEKIPHDKWPIPNGGVYTLTLDTNGAVTSIKTEPEFLFGKKKA